MSNNGASTIFRLATWIIPGLLFEIVTCWLYWLPFSAKIMETISIPPPKNEYVFIRDLNDLTLQIIFDAWWTSMNVDSKLSIAWNNSTHAPSWRFYLHCGLEESGSPGIIWIVCHQVLRHPSEHGTSSMGKHLLAKAHIAKSNELTESEVSELSNSTVDGTALAILKRQVSRGITIVRSQLTVLFDIEALAILTVIADKTI